MEALLALVRQRKAELQIERDRAAAVQRAAHTDYARVQALGAFLAKYAAYRTPAADRRVDELTPVLAKSPVAGPIIDFLALVIGEPADAV